MNADSERGESERVPDNNKRPPAVGFPFYIVTGIFRDIVNVFSTFYDMIREVMEMAVRPSTSVLIIGTVAIFFWRKNVLIISLLLAAAVIVYFSKMWTTYTTIEPVRRLEKENKNKKIKNKK